MKLYQISWTLEDVLVGIPTPSRCCRVVPTSLTPALDVEIEYQGLSHWAANSDPCLNPGSDISDLEVVEVEISDTEPFPDAQLFEPAGQEPVWTPTQIESPDHFDVEDMANDARGPDTLQREDPWPRSTSIPVPTRPASFAPMAVDAGDISSLLQSSPPKKQNSGVFMDLMPLPPKFHHPHQRLFQRVQQVLPHQSLPQHTHHPAPRTFLTNRFISC